ncbi:hypothetical protein QQ045_001430 [Rhodiola kirilowii]
MTKRKRVDEGKEKTKHKKEDVSSKKMTDHDAIFLFAGLSESDQRANVLSKKAAEQSDQRANVLSKKAAEQSDQRANVLSKKAAEQSDQRANVLSKKAAEQSDQSANVLSKKAAVQSDRNANVLSKKAAEQRSDASRYNNKEEDNFLLLLHELASNHLILGKKNVKLNDVRKQMRRDDTVRPKEVKMSNEVWRLRNNIREYIQKLGTKKTFYASNNIDLEMIFLYLERRNVKIASDLTEEKLTSLKGYARDKNINLID